MKIERVYNVDKKNGFYVRLRCVFYTKKIIIKKILIQDYKKKNKKNNFSQM